MVGCHDGAVNRILPQAAVIGVAGWRIERPWRRVGWDEGIGSRLVDIVAANPFHAEEVRPGHERQIREGRRQVIRWIGLGDQGPRGVVDARPDIQVGAFAQGGQSERDISGAGFER